MIKPTAIKIAPMPIFNPVTRFTTITTSQRNIMAIFNLRVVFVSISIFHLITLALSSRSMGPHAKAAEQLRKIIEIDPVTKASIIK